MLVQSEPTKNSKFVKLFSRPLSLTKILCGQWEMSFPEADRKALAVRGPA